MDRRICNIRKSIFVYCVETICQLVVTRVEERFISTINSQNKFETRRRPKNLYVFTPDAFFELLTNANALKTQKVIPKVYHSSPIGSIIALPNVQN